MQGPKTIRLFPLAYQVKKMKSYCSGYILHFFISLIYIFSKYIFRRLIEEKLLIQIVRLL
jgi:hypothetical protein